MYIGAEVDDDEVFGQMLRYVFGKLPPESIIIIAKELSENLSWNILRDKVYLAILYTSNRYFIPFLKERLEKEKGIVMKQNVQQVIDKLEKG